MDQNIGIRRGQSQSWLGSDNITRSKVDPGLDQQDQSQAIPIQSGQSLEPWCLSQSGPTLAWIQQYHSIQRLIPGWISRICPRRSRSDPADLHNHGSKSKGASTILAPKLFQQHIIRHYKAHVHDPRGKAIQCEYQNNPWL